MSKVRRPDRSRSEVFSAAVLVLVAVMAAACGGVATPGVASLGTTTTTDAAADAGVLGGGASLQQAYQQELDYSQCMRTHGEPNFPDPVLSAHGINTKDPTDQNSPQYLSANAACKKLVPDGGPPSPAQLAEMTAKALKHSQCMRAHGEPNFPDPVTSGGGISITISKGEGIDPDSPQFQAAQKICQKDAPLGQGI
jgi:hypothetical protein